jgi:hypothetical protein
MDMVLQILCSELCSLNRHVERFPIVLAAPAHAGETVNYGGSYLPLDAFPAELRFHLEAEFHPTPLLAGSLHSPCLCSSAALCRSALQIIMSEHKKFVQSKTIRHHLV